MFSITPFISDEVKHEGHVTLVSAEYPGLNSRCDWASLVELLCSLNVPHDMAKGSGNLNPLNLGRTLVALGL